MGVYDAQTEDSAPYNSQTSATEIILKSKKPYSSLFLPVAITYAQMFVSYAKGKDWTYSFHPRTLEPQLLPTTKSCSTLVLVSAALLT